MIISMGEALIDFVPEDAAGSGSGEGRVRESGGPDPGAAVQVRYIPVPGGSPYNCAVAAGRLGAEVRFLGKISTDFFGDQLVAHLEANSVGTELISRADNPTTLAFVKKESGGQARYAFFTNGAADVAFSPGDVPGELPEKAFFQFGSISLIPDPSSSTILSLVEREKGKRIASFDPNIRTVLVRNDGDYRRRVERAIGAAAVVKVSDEDLEWIFPDESLSLAINRVLELGPRLVVVTQGGDGSLAVTERGTVNAPAVETRVSDTIGAGDSFHAALLSWLDVQGVRDPEDLSRLEEADLRDALTFAGRVAAITCSRPGNDPPWKAELA